MQKKDILQLLIDKQLITNEQAKELAQEAENTRKPIDKILAEKKIIDEEELAKLRADFYNLQYVNLAGKEIDEAAINTFSSEVAENYHIVCFENQNGQIKVALTDPNNFKAIEAIDFLSKENQLRAEYFLVSEKSFQHAFKQYKTFSSEISTALKSRAEEKKEEEDKQKEEMELKEVTKSAPVVKIVSVIIRHAVEGGASDIHIEPLEKESRVRYRIDGILHTSLVLPRSVHDSIVARIKVMANLKLDETRIPQDGRIKLKIMDNNLDFRVSILPLVGAEKVVMRILYTNRGAPKLDELGYLGEQFDLVTRSVKQTEGMILVTGPTGSGKSTTLFGLLDLINDEGINISTLEDPVEYQMPGISQSQIKPEIGYTFSSGLRSFLRQDPDVIMVGEIRDNETAELSIHAALTGHLVLSTLHTTSAIGAIARFVDMDVEPFLLGSTLKTIIAQRLVRKVCPKCKAEFDMPAEYLKEIKEEINNVGADYIKSLDEKFDINNLKFYKGAGCPSCGNSGYSGRLCISESLEINQALKDMIMEGKNIKVQDVRESQFYTTMKQDGIIKVVLGMTTMEEILRVMHD